VIMVVKIHGSIATGHGLYLVEVSRPVNVPQSLC
jgi:hypothetical protein